MTKKTVDDYQTLAEQRGFGWLGPEVENAHQKTTWECSKGYHWEANYNNIQQGKGCPHCVGLVRKVPKDYYKLASFRGFIWLGPTVSSVDQKTMWECSNEHRWKACFSNIRKLKGCPYCAGNAPKTDDEYHTLAKDKGLIWLGPKVRRVSAKTGWKCKKGHEWRASYNQVKKQKYECGFCFGHPPRTSYDYHELAKRRGYLWLGNEIANARTKTTWKCNKDHQWMATYDHIRQGEGCPYCSGVAPKTPGDYLELAKSRGFTWVGPMVRSVTNKTRWKCPKGHFWESGYSPIQQGSGCPMCVDMVQGAKVSQVQRKLCKMLGGELNRRNQKYNIDVAIMIDNMKIAVEYDSWYWHAKRNAEDKMREDRLIMDGWRVLRIKSNELLPTRLQINNAISKLKGGKRRIEIIMNDWGKGPVHDNNKITLSLDRRVLARRETSRSIPTEG